MKLFCSYNGPATPPRDPFRFVNEPYIHEMSKFVEFRHDLHDPKGKKLMSLSLGPKSVEFTTQPSLRYVEKRFMVHEKIAPEMKEAFNACVPLPANAISFSYGSSAFQPTEQPHIFVSPNPAKDKLMYAMYTGDSMPAALQKTSLLVGDNVPQNGFTYYFSPGKMHFALKEESRLGWKVTSTESLVNGHTWIKYARCDKKEEVEFKFTWPDQTVNMNYANPTEGISYTSVTTMTPFTPKKEIPVTSTPEGDATSPEEGDAVPDPVLDAVPDAATKPTTTEATRGSKGVPDISEKFDEITDGSKVSKATDRKVSKAGTLVIFRSKKPTPRDLSPVSRAFTMPSTNNKDVDTQLPAFNANL